MLNACLRAPVNFFSMVVLCAVFLVTHGRATGGDARLRELRRAWGSVEVLNWVSVEGDRSEVVEPDLHGPFDLWDGQWWRVPLSSVHHVDLLHLACNLIFVAVCGPWLEQRWGWFVYGLFLIAAAMIAILPEYLAGGLAIGYSGVSCAIFGALLPLRRDDPELQELMSDEFVSTTLLALLAMALMTWAGALQVANLAHFTGLALGWIISKARAVLSLSPSLASAAVLAGAMSLIGCFWLVSHPAWNGQYQWYEADLERRRGASDEEIAARLRRAVASDPSLARVWRILKDDALRRGDVLSAWDELLEGLKHNPSDEFLWQETRALWRKLVLTELRETAIARLQDRFGAEADQWLAQVRRVVPPPVLIAPNRPPEPTATVVERPSAKVIEWEPPPGNGWGYLDVPDSSPLPAIDPKRTDSAVEGTLL